MPDVRQEVLAEAQPDEAHAVRVRRSAAVLLRPLPEEVHAEHDAPETPDPVPQHLGASEKIRSAV